MCERTRYVGEMVFCVYELSTYTLAVCTDSLTAAL